MNMMNMMNKNGLPMNKSLHRMRTARASKNTIKALHALVVLGGNLADHLHLIVPSILHLVEDSGTSVTVRVQSIHTMTHLCHVLNFSDYASRMIHSFTRLLEAVQRSSSNSNSSSNNTSSTTSNNTSSGGGGGGSSSSNNSSSNHTRDAVRGLIKPTMDALCALVGRMLPGLGCFTQTPFNVLL